MLLGNVNVSSIVKFSICSVFFQFSGILTFALIPYEIGKFLANSSLFPLWYVILSLDAVFALLTVILFVTLLALKLAFSSLFTVTVNFSFGAVSSLKYPSKRILTVSPWDKSSIVIYLVPSAFICNTAVNVFLFPFESTLVTPYVALSVSPFGVKLEK